VVVDHPLSALAAALLFHANYQQSSNGKASRRVRHSKAHVSCALSGAKCLKTLCVLSNLF